MMMADGRIFQIHLKRPALHIGAGRSAKRAQQYPRRQRAATSQLFHVFGLPGKKALVRAMYSRYAGRRSPMSFSSSVTPDTFSSSTDISSGDTSAHHAPADSAIKQKPHHTQNSPK